MTKMEKVWLAGLLEGEGCFIADTHGTNRRPHLIVALQMCDLDVVERAATLMNGNVTRSGRKIPRPNESQSYRVKVGGAKAEKVMRAVRPFMGLRRSAKIDSLLSIESPSHYKRPDAPHGTNARYSNKRLRCRCSKCRQAHNTYMKEYKLRRAASSGPCDIVLEDRP